MECYSNINLEFATSRVHRNWYNCAYCEGKILQKIAKVDRMTKAKFLSFFVIFLIGIMFVSSIFAVLPLVKADADSQNTTGVGLNGVDNNQGTYCYLNGYDVFVLDDTIQFYSGNGSYLAKSIGTTPNGVMEKERVLVFNSTAIIVVMLGQTTDAVARLDAWIINTVGWNNITFGLTVTTNGENNGVWSTYSSDFVFAFINNVYYVYISAVYTYDSNYAYYSSIVQVNKFNWLLKSRL